MHAPTFPFDSVVPPGDYIKEFAAVLDVSPSAYVCGLGMDETRFSQLLDGKVPIDRDIAELLQFYTGLYASTWMALQSRWDAYRAEMKARDPAVRHPPIKEHQF